MKARLLLYIIILIGGLGCSMISCDSEDNISENIEGHWVHVETSANVALTDPDLEKTVIEYIENYNKAYQISYEFKNDKTYYYYINYAAPIKGIYKTVTKETYILDDSRGIQNTIMKDDNIYILRDRKSEIAKELNIDKSKIIKATSIDVYERGLIDSE